mmetsp:Transcript_24390/g.30011  ORF Transcript_24390/g.30011 Transcript_24390/m.30011 type:complete len:974 (+) Transcript_24390:103-3024(+)
MSRFWAAQSSSSDSDGSSSDDSSLASSDDDKNRGTANRWVEFSDSDESEEEERVAKSAKDRTFESLTNGITKIKNAMKIHDYNTIQSTYQSLLQTVSSTKAKAIIQANGGVPRFFVKFICNFEVYIAERKKDKPAFKKLSPSQGRALNRMALNVKKELKVYEKLMKEYRANPDAALSGEESGADESDDEASVASSSSSSSSDSDDDSDASSKSSKSSSSSSSSSKSSAASDDDEEWEHSSSSSSSSDEDPQAGTELKGRARWLKRTVEVNVKVKKDKENRNKDKRDKVAKGVEEKKEDVEEEAELTAAILDRKCNELVSSRGRKGTDTKAILAKLEKLSKLAVQFGPRIEVPILMHVITAQFDLVRNLDDCMEAEPWKACMEQLDRVASILEDENVTDDSKKYRLSNEIIDANDLMIGNVLTNAGANKMKDAAAGIGDLGALDTLTAKKELINPHTSEVETADDRAERLRVEKEAGMTEEQLLVIPVVGSLSLFVTRLDNEYYKGLKRTSPHSIDYVHRLRDEAKVVGLLTKVRQYFMRVDSKDEASEMSLLKVEHIYYCHDSIAKQLQFFTEDIGSEKLVSDLCTFVYQHGTDRSKTRAMMCQIYHHALHDRFLEARDLLLMSHLQDNIANVGDVSTMILFNRMMVNLGLAAFRLGKIWDAHQCLSDICSGRVRELLAQGVTTGRYAGDKSIEEEKAEKRRQIPYHQHINIDLLEACHLISAMLLEVPNMAAAGDGAASSRKRRIFSRQFRKHVESFRRQVFAGPPEQTRDYIMSAAEALMNGDWKKCADFLCNLEVWKLLPGDNVTEQINKMLVEKIKLEGLRTYLFKYSAHYDSLSHGQLCGMFELSKNEVHSVVSKMMFNGDLHASWDQPTDTIVLKKIEPSTLQRLALQFAEKAANLVESNERLLDTKSGRYAMRDDGWKNDNQNRGGQSQRRGGYTRNAQGGRGRGRGGRGRDGGGRGRGRGRGRSW